MNKTLLLASTALLLCAHPMLAELVIYEDFNYSAGSLSGVATNSTGLSGSWFAGGETGNGSGATFTILDTSLNFAGHFASTGGALQLANTDGSSATAGAQVSGVLGGHTTLYTSSIQTMNTSDVYYNDWVLEQRFNTATDGGYQTSSGRNQVSSYGSGAVGDRLAGVSTNSGEVTNATLTLAAGTKYLLVTKYDIIGTDVTAATLYAFNETAYAAYLANSTPENASANLATYALFSLSDGDTTPLSNFNFLQFSIQGGPTGVFDDFRLGTEITDVVNVGAVPEPSTTGLGIVALLVGSATWLRRSKLI